MITNPNSSLRGVPVGRPEVQVDGEPFQLGTMYCIGRNYAAHAREMGAPRPPAPLVFLKPPTALLPEDQPITRPSWSALLHHEIELVVLIGSDCINLGPNDAGSAIAGYGVGIDLTLRDIQDGAKQRGEPWAVAKGFRGSAPLSPFVRPDHPALRSGEPFTLHLTVNGKTRQYGTTDQMERSVSELIAYLSSVFHLTRGDLVFTGTPAGVGALIPGDLVVAELLHGSTLLTSLTRSVG
jgi:2-keto-4-pentenoate hydratase/2-oxohepta-3-ene-1,7-dioic acid hydratase in catechol pathway